ncbi:MAG: hypothetical protein WBI34_02795, partial [Tenuifilaceae bacterium]
MTNRPFLLTFVFLAIAFGSLAQGGKEVLVELESIPMGTVPPLASKDREAIELPFFDDFSWGKP